MKVLFIHPSLISCGPTNQTFYLMKGLIELGIDVDIVFFNRKVTPIDKDMQSKFNTLGCRQYHFTRNISGIVSARKLLKEIKPDVIQSSLLFADLIAFLIGFDMLRVITHRTDPRDHIVTQGFVRGGLFFLLSKFLSNRSNSSVAVAKSISHRLRLNGIQVNHVVENCTPPRMVYSNNVMAKCVRKKINILSIGSLCNRKNPIGAYNFVKNLSHFLGHEFQILLHFLGDGELRPLLTNLPNENNLSIHCPGHVNINNYLRDADLHISSSTAEGMPNSVLETLAAGIPNVLSNIPEHLEFSHFENKIVSYFELDGPYNKIELSSAAVLLSNRSLGDFDDFRERYSYIATSKSYLTIYANILGERINLKNESQERF